MDNTLVIYLAVAAGAYLLGSIPFGLLMARTFGRADVREEGSGNIGATNVARVAGPVAGVLTLLLDAAKGFAAVYLAGKYTGDSSTAMMIAGMGVLAGHCFPLWLNFKGGKGVAPSLGVFLALCPWAALIDLALFIAVTAMWKYVSLASITAAAAMPLLVYFLWAPMHAPPLMIIFGTMAIAILVVYKHDANIQRLVEGAEPRFSLGGGKGPA